MPTTAAAKKIEPDAPPPEAPGRKLLIDPTCVLLQASGLCWAEYMVRLPQGASMGDLIEPSIWSRVQAQRRPNLRKFDRLAIVAFDEAWMVECVVAEASDLGVTISKPVRTELDQRSTVNLFQDDLYRIVWCGTGFAVERKKDNVRVTPIVANQRLAMSDLRAMYPRTAV